jgi:hypothetical protein
MLDARGQGGLVTVVHIQYRQLDSAAPVVFVEARGRGYAALDSNRRADAEAILEILLMARYGPDGWSVAAPQA